MKPFASPDHLDLEFKEALTKTCSVLCDWMGEAGKRGPLPGFIPDIEIMPRSKGLHFDQLISDLHEVMEGSFQPSHPGSLAHLDPPPLTASIIGDLICAALNNNLLAEELSPSLTKLERNLIKWFCIRLGLPNSSGGVMASGGSLSNLMALVMAREAADLSTDHTAVVLASEDSHVSIEKAIRVMGLAQDSFRRIKTDSSGQMDIDDLAENVRDIRDNGRNVFVVIATAGTTIRGVIDPITYLAEFCREEGLWLHIDGAIGGVFALSESTKSLLTDISRADSLTLNPQKVLGITKTSSVLLVSNKKHLENTFSTGLPYVEPATANESHGGEIGIQGSRSAEILKLWLGLRHLGEEGIDLLLNHSIKRRIYFEELVDKSKFQILGGPLHLLSFTENKQNSENDSCVWSQNTKSKLLKEGFMLSRPFHKGRFCLKAVFGNPHTSFYHLDQLASIINDKC